MAFPTGVIACDPDLSTGSADGSSWEDAYQTIQAAINACSGTPDEIWIKARSVTLSSGLSINQACDIYGGFDNALTSDNGSVAGRSSTSRTTVDGNDTYQICNFTATAKLDGFVLHQGSAARGAAAYSNAGDDGTFVNCKFTHNNASEYGGALYWNVTSTLTVTDCEFTNNVCTGGDGGAITMRGSAALTVSGSTFGGSDATKNVAEGGGCIFAMTGGTVTATDCTFDSNDATAGFADGGAFFSNSTGTHSFTRCHFTNNWADDDGGAIFLQYGTTTLNSCLFALNAADDDGGAIECYSGSTLNVNNCTFADNTSIDGSAIKGGGTCTIINSCFWDNTGAADLDGTFTVTYSNVEGGYTGTGNINVDPNFTGSGDHPYQPDTTSDMITGGSNGDMTAYDILGDTWDDDTMGCYNLLATDEDETNPAMLLFNF